MSKVRNGAMMTEGQLYMLMAVYALIVATMTGIVIATEKPRK